MTNSSPNPGLGQSERLLLVVLAALLAAGLLWSRGGLHPEAPLERLARQSLDLQVALGNGKPTVVEFYADWCEACRSMAPAMETIEAQHRGSLDVVLLNVDNPRWQPELERFDVNGIPQLELFNAAGTPVGRSIGARSTAELQALTGALIAGEPLPALAGMGAVSSLEATPDAIANVTGAPKAATMAGPRSHA
jgi:thiol-disulfide isomerase/thioredoxin